MRSRRRQPSGPIGFAVVLAFCSVSKQAPAQGPTMQQCLSANESAITLRANHQLRRSRDQSVLCSAEACPAIVRTVCERRIADLDVALPTIVFDAKDPQGHDLGAVRVVMDGVVLVEQLNGRAIAVDPGEHTFAFEAEGQARVERHWLIGQDDKERHEGVVIGAARPATSPATPVALPSTPSDSPALPAQGMPRQSTDGGGTQRILAWVSGAVGVAGVATGAAFGALSVSKHNSAESVCPGSACSTSSGVSLWHDAVTSGNVSNIAFIVGGAGLAGAVVLWWTLPKSNAHIGIAPAALRFGGTW